MVTRDCILNDIAELIALAAQWRAQSLTIGFTCGAFDLLHAGHVDYLEKAKSMCDRLVVAVNSDESVRQYKSRHRPIVGQDHRMRLVSALRYVDAVILMNETRPAKLISAFRPDLYIKGGDYREGELKSAEVVESYGGRCEIIPLEHDISSSQIVRRIEELSRYAEPGEPLISSGPIAFLDRDGTLIEHVRFLRDPSRVKLLEGVGEGLRLLQEHGFRLVVLTNQQGIGLGYFDYDDFVSTNSAMLCQLAPYGVKISRFYYCPHSLADNCQCRKPGSKLVMRALEEFSAQPQGCFLIGDAESDILAADAAGCKGILVSKSNSQAGIRSAPSFLDAARLILSLSKSPNP